MDPSSGSKAGNRPAHKRTSVRVVAGLDAVLSAEDVGPVKSGSPPLDPDISLDAALAGIIGACLDHFVANWPALRCGNDVESVHQMRVALRRLRACLSFARRRFPACAALDAGAARARAVATALGDARDWDVFRENIDSGPRDRLSGEPSFYALLDTVELRRARAYESARALIAAPATRQFALDLRQAAARRVWREPNGDADCPPSGAPGSARVFAARTLDKLHRRAEKKCAGLADLAPEQRHEARIALKKLRYAAEFFQTLFDNAAGAKAYLRTLAKIQECLGADNDLATANRLIGAIVAGDDGKTALAAGFLRGWQAHAQEERLAVNKKNERIVKKLEPFWR